MIWKAPFVQGALFCGLKMQLSISVASRICVMDYSSTTRNCGKAVLGMTAHYFNNLLKDPEVRSQWQIIDVREPDEINVAKVPGKDVHYMPLSASSSWTQQIATGHILDSSKQTACLCHHGARSFKVANFLGIYSIFLFSLQLYAFSLQFIKRILTKFTTSKAVFTR